MCLFKTKTVSNKRFFFGAAGFLILTLIWVLVTSLSLISPLLLPPPLEVIKALINLFIEKNVLNDIFTSLYRVWTGFIIIIIISIPVGIFIGFNKTVEKLFDPIISFVRYTPPAAFIPLSILWFGLGNIERWFILFIVLFPLSVTLISDAVANVKREFIEVGYLFGANSQKVYTKVIFPSILPSICDIMRLMIAGSWAFVIVIELVAANSGLGYRIIQSQRFLQTSEVISLIIIIGVIGLITDYIFKCLYNKFFPWMEKAEKKC